MAQSDPSKKYLNERIQKFHYGNKAVIPVMNNRFIGNAYMNDYISKPDDITFDNVNFNVYKDSYYPRGTYTKGEITGKPGWSFLQLWGTIIHIDYPSKCLLLPITLTITGKIIKNPDHFIAYATVYFPILNVYLNFYKQDSGKYTWRINDSGYHYYETDTLQMTLKWDETTQKYVYTLYALMPNEDPNGSGIIITHRSYSTLELLELLKSETEFIQFGAIEDGCTYEFDFKSQGYLYNKN